MKKNLVMRPVMLAALMSIGLSAAHAQGSAADGIAKYREMLQDGNPAELFEAKGEDLWKQKRGPKNASLEQCDLGKGPGVTKGAFVELPRFFKDTGRVQDLETRLITCMETLQGFNGEEIAKTPFRQGEMANVTATWPRSPKACASNCRKPTSKKKPCSKWASVPSSNVPVPTISRAPLATVRTTNASVCKICPT
jgi:hypothetical protein